ncbi:MAG: DNA-3-methyladenine glycosylase 2 family protein [Defluviicoccus sp.]|nr:DNA-3-methyladenine glycosylase 2 family protein [Defluviicoccus sp.]
MGIALTRAAYEAAIAELAARDPALGRVVADYGPPPRWKRKQGFATLVLLILEQQVSLASAEATFARLEERAGAIEPGAILALGEERMKEAGLSRQKARYVHGLAAAAASGGIDFRKLGRAADEAVRAALIPLKGIGDWTVDIYLLAALQRPDVWPARDLALQEAARAVKGLDARPDEKAMHAIGEAWRPWRSVAARILWHHYLNTRRRGRA